MPVTTNGAQAQHWGRRVIWLVALWLAGVGSLGLLAFALKAVMRFVGMSS